MTFDRARFEKFISGLGLSPSLSSGRLVTLFQGTPDTLQSGKDSFVIKDGHITQASYLEDKGRISFAEIESVMAISERLKTERFPALELKFTITDRITGVTASPLGKIPVMKSTDESLSGLPASAGKVTGTCTLSPEDATGKILVVKNSQNLPDLRKMKLRGMILEEGSLLSHAAILAREAQIPAVMMVRNATKKIKEGDEVLLDATHGLISIRTSRCDP